LQALKRHVDRRLETPDETPHRAAWWNRVALLNLNSSIERRITMSWKHWMRSLVLTIGTSTGLLNAAEPAADQPVKATFAVTGLHCPPCTSTVERSQKSVQGIKNAKVDWATKSAKVEFDEHAVSAQQIASRIASTPYMMGSSLHYGSTFSLSVPDLEAAGNAEKAPQALLAVPGVSAVTPSVQKKAVALTFKLAGERHQLAVDRSSAQDGHGGPCQPLSEKQ
jgi:copper chaperone CopZ